MISIFIIVLESLFKLFLKKLLSILHVCIKNFENFTLPTQRAQAKKTNYFYF